MIDSLVVLGDSLFTSGLSVADCATSAKELGISHMVAAPARGRDYDLRAANERLAEAAAPHGNISRLARVDANQGSSAVDELRRAAASGCVGLFLNPDEEVFRIQEAEDVVRAAGEAGLPTVIVAGVPHRSEPLQILDLARKVPEAHLVLTSGGQVNISGLSMVDAWTALCTSNTIAVLSNGEYRQDFLERIVRELGPERLLFGSFAPYYERPFEAARIRNVAWDPWIRARVEEQNARDLFLGGRRQDDALG